MCLSVIPSGQCRSTSTALTLPLPLPLAGGPLRPLPPLTGGPLAGGPLPPLAGGPLPPLAGGPLPPLPELLDGLDVITSSFPSTLPFKVLTNLFRSDSNVASLVLFVASIRSFQFAMRYLPGQSSHKMHDAHDHLSHLPNCDICPNGSAAAAW